MPSRLAICSLVLSLLIPTPAHSQQSDKIPRPAPTARDLYLGCSLLIRDETLSAETYDDRSQKPYSAISCGLAAFVALGYENRIKPGNEWVYCLPRNASTSTGVNQQKTMAMAYVDFYERIGRAKPDMAGFDMMLYAFKDTWPCK